MRQPIWSVRLASSGRNTSCPVATLAVRMPTTRPRRAANQRVGDGRAQHQRGHAGADADHDAPQQHQSCQTLVIASEATSADTTISSADSVTLRRP